MNEVSYPSLVGVNERDAFGREEKAMRVNRHVKSNPRSIMMHDSVSISAFPQYRRRVWYCSSGRTGVCTTVQLHCLHWCEVLGVREGYRVIGSTQASSDFMTQAAYYVLDGFCCPRVAIVGLPRGPASVPWISRSPSFSKVLLATGCWVNHVVRLRGSVRDCDCGSKEIFHAI